jgi:hypothetical protein
MVVFAFFDSFTAWLSVNGCMVEIGFSVWSVLDYNAF